MDQKNRNRWLYTLLIIGWTMNAVGMSYGTVDIEADLIVVNYKKKIITASGNVAVEAADIQAQTPYIEYNYLTDIVNFSGDSAIQYKQNHLKGSDFMVKLRENSVISSEKSTITIQLD